MIIFLVCNAKISFLFMCCHGVSFSPDLGGGEFSLTFNRDDLDKWTSLRVMSMPTLPMTAPCHLAEESLA